LIGDRAIHSPRQPFAEIWDLGDEWCRWAELPFVFAMWVARAGADLQGIDTALSQARDLGVEHLEQIAATEAAPLGLTRPECLSYLRDNLHFHLGPRERQGLELFREQAVRMMSSTMRERNDNYAESVALQSPGSPRSGAPWVTGAGLPSQP
jgi:chorismate dehydratase